MSESDPLLPVARFHPSPGIVVDRTELRVTIGGSMEFSGPEANLGRALSVQQSINRAWTHDFDNGCSVSCNVVVWYRGRGPTRGNITQIIADRIEDSSNVETRWGVKYMTLNADEKDAFTWAAAHEFGHIIGLRDRYTESILSEIKARWGGKRVAWVDPGYRKNLMGQTGGVLFRRNIKDIARENGPGWLDDDDQVRAWVNARSPSEITQLATASKLAAIKTLMSGWTSGDDLQSLRKICACAASKTEADAIRQVVDRHSVLDLGRRAEIRSILARLRY
jgi:hypothetical protein